MGVSDCLCTRLRKAEVPHLAFLNQVPDGSRDVFNWNVQINTVLIKEINRLKSQPLEGRLGDLLDVLGSAIEGAPSITVTWIGFPPELRRDCDLPAIRLQSFTDQLLIFE